MWIRNSATASTTRNARPRAATPWPRSSRWTRARGPMRSRRRTTAPRSGCSSSTGCWCTSCGSAPAPARSCSARGTCCGPGTSTARSRCPGGARPGACSSRPASPCSTGASPPSRAAGRHCSTSSCAGASMRARAAGFLRAVTHLTRVDDRLLVLMWFLAERWGRVRPEGVVVPLKLTHQLLAALVGAKRPSVTTALGELTAAGLDRAPRRRLLAAARRAARGTGPPPGRRARRGVIRRSSSRETAAGTPSRALGKRGDQPSSRLIARWRCAPSARPRSRRGARPPGARGPPGSDAGGRPPARRPSAPRSRRG